ncbi:MAG: hypothetical protein ACLU2J_01305 [Clostridia bacterium]
MVLNYRPKKLIELISNATKEGLTMAVKELNPRPDLIIVDALTKIDTDGYHISLL